MLLTLSVEESQERVVALTTKTGVERVPLADSLGRILREVVRARANVPPHPNSAMDGYAVRAADLVGAGAETPVRLQMIGESAAGHAAGMALGAGQAIRIMTGALIPAGADSVVMVEHTHAEPNDMVRTERATKVGDHIRPAGDDMREGDLILLDGERISPSSIGLLASLKRSSIDVARKPTVSIFSTGDELRDLDDAANDPATIADSNSYTLAALVREAGGEPLVHPIVRDNPADLRAAIERAKTSDLILSTGGVSVGEHDHVKEVLTDLGAELIFWRVAMKPGKPVAVFRLGRTPYFGLPGNPVSAMIAFHLFVRPALRASLGCAETFDLTSVEVILDAPIKTGDRRHYARARVHHRDGSLHATPMAKQGSHVLTSMLHADALIVIEPGSAPTVGARVPALLLPGPL